jgi:hypothetical protein
MDRAHRSSTDDAWSAQCHREWRTLRHLLKAIRPRREVAARGAFLEYRLTMSSAAARLHRTLEQFRRLRERLEEGSFGFAGRGLRVIPDECRRAEDRIRDELHDTRAITVRARKKR